MIMVLGKFRENRAYVFHRYALKVGGPNPATDLNNGSAFDEFFRRHQDRRTEEAMSAKEKIAPKNCKSYGCIVSIQLACVSGKTLIVYLTKSSVIPWQIRDLLESKTVLKAMIDAEVVFE